MIAFRSSALLVLVACLVLAGAPARAHADAPPAPNAADVEKARQLYEQGNTHYDLAEYDRAIELFKQAYTLSKRPTLLYNIAQAYRLKGDCAMALQFYKNFRRLAPEGELRTKVEERIAEMEQCVKAGQAAPPPKEKEAVQADPDAAKPPAPTDDRPPAPTEPARPGRTKKLVGWISLGAGVALVATGGYFSSVAAGKSSDVEALCAAQGLPGGGCTWSDELEALQQDGEAADRNAIIFYAVGGAAITGGVVLWLLGDREADAAPTVSFAPTRDGVVAHAAWRF